MQLVNQIREDWYLLNESCYGLHELIVPLDNWVYLLGNLLELSRPSLRLTRTDVRILHLCCLGVRLKLFHFVGLIGVSKKATRKLLEEVLEDTDILPAVL